MDIDRRQICKGLFCRTIALIREQEETDRQLSKALDAVCDGHFVFGADNKRHKALMDILKEVFIDKGGYIEWSLYEDVYKAVFEGEKETRLDTPELLYDFLVKNCEDNIRNPDPDYKSPLSQLFGRRLPYRGREYLLGGIAERKPLFDNCFCVHVMGSDERIHDDVVRIYRMLARQDLTAKSEEYAAKLGVKYADIKLNAAEETLGSSSGNGSLSFSWRLVQGGDDIIDYVVFCALARLKEPSRSDKYWEAVESIPPDYKERQLKLNELKKRMQSKEWL
jgi:predicted metal-dependent hydrolase